VAVIVIIVTSSILMAFGAAALMHVLSDRLGPDVARPGARPDLRSVQTSVTVVGPDLRVRPVDEAESILGG